MIKKISNSLKRRLKNYTSYKKIIFHNLAFFKKKKNEGSRDNVILLEFNGMNACHISYAYFSYVASQKYNSKVVAYLPNYTKNIFFDFKFTIQKFTNYADFGVYKSFGTDNIFKIKFNLEIKVKAFNKFNLLIDQINSKRDLLSLKINNVLIGDLIYDTFLKKFDKITVDYRSKEFKEYFLEALRIYYFWEEYFKIHDVKALNVSHTVYILAFPLRIAIRDKIPSFQINLTHFFSLNEKNMFAYTDFKNYKNQFYNLPYETRENGKKIAKSRIKNRLTGLVGVDMDYSTMSAYHSSKVKSNIKKNTKLKVLIAAHCFYDNPHPYGDTIFEDIYEWLLFLCQISKKTNYDWYIKSHPDYIPKTREKLKEFTTKYKNFTLLPEDISHHQIISEGINVALTVHGTIGFEYAFLGIPVINASQNNPHISYDFNIHAKTKKEYRELLLNLNKLKINIDKNEIFEYYFMRNIYYNSNFFIKDYENFLLKIGGYKNLFNPGIYDKLIEKINVDDHKRIIKTITNFLNTNEFRLKT